jgi:hypothetical protein
MGSSHGPGNLAVVSSAVADNASELAFDDALAGNPEEKCRKFTVDGTAPKTAPEVSRDDKGGNNQGAPDTTRAGVHAVKAEMDSAAELAFLDELAGLDNSTKAKADGGENGVHVILDTC